MAEALLRMPRLGETMEEGRVSGWLVAPGNRFSRGDPLIEFESDKTMVELPALGDGTLVEQLAAEGERVPVGAPLARIEMGDGPDWVSAKNAESASSESSPVHAGSYQESSVSRSAEHNDFAPTSSPVRSSAPYSASRSASDTERPRATPAARALARRKHINLAAITGTGRRRRIEVVDVQRFLSADGSHEQLAIENPAQRPDVSFARDIAYHAEGPASGTPWLLLHGYAADHSAWSTITRQLARKGCRVVAVDLPGHGQTRLEADTVADLHQQLEHLVNEVMGERPVHVLSHSLGAMPALAWSKRHSPASLNLISPVGLSSYIDRDFIHAMADPGSIDELAHLLGRLGDNNATMTPVALERLYQDLVRGRLRKLAAAILSGTRLSLALLPDLEAIAGTLPTRVLIGHLDRIIDAQAVQYLPPSVAVHHFRAAGHLPHWDQPSDVVDILLAEASTA